MAGSLRLGLTIAALVAVLDQATKYWLVHFSGIAEKGGRIVLGPFADLVYLRNPGISYSMFELKGEWGQWLLTGLAVAVSAGIVVWLAQTRKYAAVVGLGLVLGGAIGNAIDRPLMGGVVDFVSLHAGGFNWYVFNVADCGVVVGAAVLLYESLTGSRKTATDGV
jgi:signal peptidase II